MTVRVPTSSVPALVAMLAGRLALLFVGVRATSIEVVGASFDLGIDPMVVVQILAGVTGIVPIGSDINRVFPSAIRPLRPMARLLPLVDAARRTMLGVAAVVFAPLLLGGTDSIPWAPNADADDRLAYFLLIWLSTASALIWISLWPLTARGVGWTAVGLGFAWNLLVVLLAFDYQPTRVDQLAVHMPIAAAAAALVLARTSDAVPALWGAIGLGVIGVAIASRLFFRDSADVAFDPAQALGLPFTVGCVALVLMAARLDSDAHG